MEKNLGKLLLAIVLVITTFTFVNAQPILNAPINWGNYSTTLNFTCRNIDFANPNNVTLFYNSTGGNAQNGTATALVTIANTSANQSVFSNAAVSISDLTDGLIYNMSCIMRNNTGGTVYSAASSNITIDNTAPSCSISASYPIIHKDGPQLLTWSVTDALSLVGNNVYINRPSPGSQMSYTSATATSLLYNGLNTTYVGSYNLNAYGIDRAGNTCNVTTSFISDQPGGSISIPAGTTTGPNSKTIVVIVLVLLGAYLLFRKK